MADLKEEEEFYSDDPDEQLRMENEILKIKLKAELGGDFEPLSEVPAEIENMFLKNVLAFEHEHANAPIRTIYELLDTPPYKLSAALNDADLADALRELERIMENKGIEVDYLVEYPDRVKYVFLTEELFVKEASMMSMPGMTIHYIYEEFHPNHQYEIRHKTEYFTDHWFRQSFDEYCTEVATKLILPKGEVVKRDALFNRFQLIFDSYTNFENIEWSIDNIEFELQEDERGLGFSEGTSSYIALLENGETIHFEGPFKFYFTMEDNYWQIMYFAWPGFTWE